jgi:soluble lytic murein transglycosylase-like protein
MKIRILLGLALMTSMATAQVAGAAGAFAADGVFQVADFTFRTVRPPKSGARKRIVFQGSSTPSRPRKQAYSWFWSEVDATVAAADPARFSKLGAQIGDRLSGGWAGFGGADRARDFAADHLAALTEAAARENLSPAFLLAVIAVESAGVSKARSPKGAQGLMQLMPATARRFDVANPWDATENISGGAAYLDFLLTLFGDDPVLALAGYNAGEGAVAKYEGVPPYSETRDYVPKVLAAFLAIRDLCVVPPADVRDACALFVES